MFTIADIPSEYRKGQSDGENIARLASGVQEAIRDAVGDSGLYALDRFVQAGFLFRSSEIGRRMNLSSTALSNPLWETAQLVDFAGGVLVSTALVGAIDLTAAALYRLHLGEVDPRDSLREADVHHFPNANRLPTLALRWLEETRAAHGWEVLKAVRDQFVHRWFPMHITITLGAENIRHDLEIAGDTHPLPEFMAESRAFAIDRLVAAGLIMQQYARELS